MIKKHILLLALAALFFTISSCVKSDPAPNNCVANNTGVPTAAEVASVQAYLTANNLTATQHPDGFFYRIITQGTGVRPSSSSRITVKYTGSLTNGSVFDQSATGTTFLLSDLILGWQKGVPLIQKGGSIILYLPPSLGYGCSSAGGSIPRGSELIFNIELVDVQ